MIKTDIAIIGGGIVGLATAYHLSKEFPDKKITILEKEPTVAVHQTGHNSGVLHSGIYYKPGSLKAINCRLGKVAMQAFCQEHQIDYEICGKVIVALNDGQLPAMHRIYQRGLDNGVNCQVIDQARLKELEPHAAGIGGIHVPEAGIVNYKQVCEKLAELLVASGNELSYNTRVNRISDDTHSKIIATTMGEFNAKLIINCAGLYCDKITKLTGQKPAAQIVPFRGEYYELKPEKQYLCKTLIYPVPDPNFPFLGVHFTKMIQGGVESGPNAVLAFAREGYKKLDINPKELLETLTYPGFLKMAAKHWRMGMGEMWRSFSKQAFVKALQKLMPEIQADDLIAVPAGIRAQAVTATGGMVDDFLIQEAPGIINVNNAPSPAATASLNIGKTISQKAENAML